MQPLSPPLPSLRPVHLALAVAVAFVWGTNFVVIKYALTEMPPFLLATLRFSLCAIPWILFVPRPAIPISRIAAFGTLQGSGQIGLLFLAMRTDISAGLASVVIQSQVFFTIVASALLFRESVRPLQGLALMTAASGIALIASQSVAHASSVVTPWGLALTLTASLCWAASNLVARTFGRINVLHLMVWSSVFAVPPLLALSFAVDGVGADAYALTHASAAVWGAVGWQTVGNTLFGFGIWNWLLARYPSASVTPVALLVPVFGMFASALLLHEALPLWKSLAAALLLVALLVNVLGTLRFPPRRTAAPGAREHTKPSSARPTDR